MPEEDELIITRFVIDSDEALQNAQEFREEIDRLKLQMQTLAVEGSQSLEDIAEGMKQAAKEARAAAKEQLAQMKAEDVSDPAEIQAQQALIDEYTKKIRQIGTAFSESKKERTDYFKEGDKLANAEIAKQKQIAKEQQASLRANKAAQMEYQKITRQGYGVMSAAAQQYGQQVNRIAQIIQATAQRTGKSWQQVAQRMAALGVPINQVNAAMQQLNTQVTQSATGIRGFISRIQNLGTTAKYVFGSILGITAVSALRDVVRWVTDATKQFIDFRRSVFVLEVSVRSLQRAGFDTTIEEWTDVIDDFKKRFPIFSTQEIVSAVNVAILKLREYKFTQEEIINVLETSALLARGFGKDFGEMSERITGAITRGWFEALQSMGIPLSRIEIMQEAYNQSLDKSFNLLDESTRAHLAYQLLMENTSLITEDLANITEESFDRMTVATAELTDAQMRFGETTEETYVVLLEQYAKFIDSLADFTAGWEDAEKRANIAIGNYLIGLNRLIMKVDETAGVLGFDRMPEDQFEQLEKNIASIQSTIAMETAEMEEDLSDLIDRLRTFDNLEPAVEVQVEFAGMTFSQEDYDDMVKIVQEANEKITEIEQEAGEKRIDINEDYLDDIEDLHEAHLDRRLDLWQDYQQRLVDIGTKESQNTADEIRKYQFRIADAERDAAFRRQEAERKYRERELKEERKFQEKLRQLRENFLFDLEDAVRERDARQIIRLTRQYNMRRDQLIREEKIAKDDRQSAFEEELRQIEFQRQQRLQQLAIEHQRRLEEIAIQAERERAQAALDYERKKQEEAERYEEDKEKREERLQEQLDKLDEDTQKRVNKIIESLMKEYEATRAWLNPIAQLYENTYGPNSRIDNALVWYQRRLQQTWLLQQKLKLMQHIGSYPGGSPGAFKEMEYAGERARGGTIVADKPTVAIFGEAGPEVATFTPLNKIAGQSDMGGQIPMGARDPLTGKLRIEMMLSPDLETNIIDSALNEVADVIYTIERERR